jgi:hypothetical protein
MSTGTTGAPAGGLVVEKIPKVTIVPIPTKFVFLYPTIILAGIMSILTYSVPEHRNTWGQVFVFFALMNFIVVTFEFPRGTVLAVVLGVVAALLAGYVLNQHFRIIKGLADLFSSLDVSASSQFYLCILLAGIVLGIAIWVQTRFDYWDLTPNEFIHHKGVLGDVERFSTNGMKFNKEITDIFEYLILRSATLVVTLPTQPRPIVLENVLFIHYIMSRADQILQGGRAVRDEKELVPGTGQHHGQGGSTVVQQET